MIAKFSPNSSLGSLGTNRNYNENQIPGQGKNLGVLMNYLGLDLFETNTTIQAADVSVGISLRWCKT